MTKQQIDWTNFLSSLSVDNFLNTSFPTQTLISIHSFCLHTVFLYRLPLPSLVVCLTLKEEMKDEEEKKQL